jgi:ABC-type multidrug transport system fused ATPase/permease subunit
VLAQVEWVNQPLPLLLRFYDIDSGEILIDGKSIYEFDLENLHGNMSIVPQDVILFGEL